jgi:hypothetical protein
MPTSNAPGDVKRIRQAVEREISRAPVSGDPSMPALRECTVGEPALVRSADGASAFWLVPFEIGDRACGFARVELSGRIAQVSQFGAGADDRASWPQAEFFRRPAARVLDDIRAKHPGLALAEPVLSFDGSPAKWAWRVAINDSAAVYITPRGWYEKAAARGAPPDREG